MVQFRSLGINKLTTFNLFSPTICELMIFKFTFYGLTKKFTSWNRFKNNWKNDTWQISHFTLVDCIQYNVSISFIVVFHSNHKSKYITIELFITICFILSFNKYACVMAIWLQNQYSNKSMRPSTLLLLVSFLFRWENR